MSHKADSGKSYHLKCTGDALSTADAHSKPNDLTLFGSCFCPFVQRVWVALEEFGIDYQVHEVDPYKKPPELLEVSPKGLVPGLKFNNTTPSKSLNESTVILEYLEDLANRDLGKSLLPPTSDLYGRALVRLQADHVNRNLVPAFYKYLQAQDIDKQIEGVKEFLSSIEGLVQLFERAEKESDSKVGLWHAGNSLSLADVVAGPWLFRATNVLKHYRGFTLPEGDKFRVYLDRLVNYPAFKRTCSTEELYLESYERYAYNRPNTSQVANAINLGRALP
ncbi:glutathione S-transferase C-terminal-like protein [Irpex rosettiformis]|uniref:Glutathione S-transferase C-terminal-like protein n=1 Tax=Irpex rosettiformis TaxID=378272 RepID=A0ACB8U3P2_9APHY|nr:glutathione S-transferase C-terminal-like protein [Irpex rosettiformis]